MKARIVVSLNSDIRDPQGEAIGRALASLGFDEVGGVRVGKVIDVELDAASPDAARERLDAMAKKLLANPVMERFEIVSVSQ